MNKDEFEGNWKQLKGKIKEKWGKLTDNEVTAINGKYDQLSGAIQKRYGYEKSRAEEEIRNWKYNRSDASSSRTENYKDENKRFDKNNRENFNQRSDTRDFDEGTKRPQRDMRSDDRSEERKDVRFDKKKGDDKGEDFNKRNRKVG